MQHRKRKEAPCPLPYDVIAWERAEWEKEKEAKKLWMRIYHDTASIDDEMEYRKLTGKSASMIQKKTPERKTRRLANQANRLQNETAEQRKRRQAANRIRNRLRQGRFYGNSGQKLRDHLQKELLSLPRYQSRGWKCETERERRRRLRRNMLRRRIVRGKATEEDKREFKYLTGNDAASLPEETPEQQIRRASQECERNRVWRLNQSEEEKSRRKKANHLRKRIQRMEKALLYSSSSTLKYRMPSMSFETREAIKAHIEDLVEELNAIPGYYPRKHTYKPGRHYDPYK